MRSGQALRAHAARIWEAGLRAVDPEVAVRRFIRRRGDELLADGRRRDLRGFRNIWTIGAGKAAGPMGRAIEGILGKRLSGGILVTKYGHGVPLRKLQLLEAGHPLPDANGVAAGGRIAELIETGIGPGDLVFCLFSGGGSALLVAPAKGISWQEKQQCTQLLLKSGASIHEMNAVRKHLSSLKGGGLARLLASRTVISLILSDVVGDQLDTIASGPLAPDTTSFSDCLGIFERLRITDRVPPSILERMRAGARSRIAETPKPGDPIFRGKQNVIVGSNGQACTAAAAAARRLGYHTMVLTSRNEGDTAESARFHMSVVQEIVSCERPLRMPACIISGGETTVQVTGAGKGGRNQEFVMQCVRPLAGVPAPCLTVSLGTDGTDGPTDAAGAMADNGTLARSERFGSRFLDNSLANNDSYHYFQRLGDLIVTGPTRTNVMDLRIILIGTPAPRRRRTDRA